ncbi:hypothetical protein V6N11_033968 [Hibiscus sabdariffa]|uniref:Uncharacterized protein n=1 Tax=Hibiscus sabdariffa TaxID=183260 RepID=A0ABR2S1K8_9ROSI
MVEGQGGERLIVGDEGGSDMVKNGEVLVWGCRCLARGLVQWPWCSVKDRMRVGRWCANSDDERLKVS